MSYGSCQDPVGNPADSPELPFSSKAKGYGGGGGDQVAVGFMEEPNLAFCDVSYTIPPSLLSRKKKKVILDSVRSVAGDCTCNINRIAKPDPSCQLWQALMLQMG